MTEDQRDETGSIYLPPPGPLYGDWEKQP